MICMYDDDDSNELGVLILECLPHKTLKGIIAG